MVLLGSWISILPSQPRWFRSPWIPALLACVSSEVASVGLHSSLVVSAHHLQSSWIVLVFATSDDLLIVY